MEFPQNINDLTMTDSLEILKQFLDKYPKDDLVKMDEWVYSKLPENTHFRIIQTRDNELMFSLEDKTSDEILKVYSYVAAEEQFEAMDKYKSTRNMPIQERTNIFKRVNIPNTVLDYMNNLRRNQ